MISPFFFLFRFNCRCHGGRGGGVVLVPPSDVFSCTWARARILRCYLSTPLISYWVSFIPPPHPRPCSPCFLSNAMRSQWSNDEPKREMSTPSSSPPLSLKVKPQSASCFVYFLHFPPYHRCEKKQLELLHRSVLTTILAVIGSRSGREGRGVACQDGTEAPT